MKSLNQFLKEGYNYNTDPKHMPCGNDEIAFGKWLENQFIKDGFFTRDQLNKYKKKNNFMSLKDNALIYFDDVDCVDNTTYDSETIEDIDTGSTTWTEAYEILKKRFTDNGAIDRIKKGQKME